MLDAPHIAQTAARLTAVIHVTIPRGEKMTPDIFDFEIGVPVAAPVIAAGRVKPSQWAAMKVARAIYRGPYEGLGNAWGEFNAWIEAEGHAPAPDLWECYVAGPESGPDPANWRTELNRPLTSRGHS